MTDPLDEWLTAAMRLPWAWGISDCTIWVADWCVIRFGHDPAAGFRGRYDDAAGAEALIAAGLATTITPCMTPMTRTASPARGDVGVIVMGGREVAAICTGPRWAFRTPRALAEAEAIPLISWSDPCRR